MLHDRRSGPPIGVRTAGSYGRLPDGFRLALPASTP